MIAKAVKGRGFRGALEYDLRKDHARVIDSNMTGNSPRELAAEFGEIRKLRPGLNKAVLHVSLSAAPGERLTDRQWVDIARRYLQGMGLEQNQYVLTRHLDTDHEHVHLLANRIRFDGTVTSESHDYRRQEALMRTIEHDLGLRQVALSRDCERRAASKGEIEEGQRTGCASTRQQLQQLCDAAMVDCPGFAAYAERLMAAGVELVPVTQLEGTKLSGLSYRLDGVTMKGSDLGKRYSPAGLAKHGVGYDKERDFETVGRCLERGAPGQPGTTAPVLACGPDRERGTVGVDAGTAGTGDGRSDGGITRDAGGHRAAVPGAGRELEGPSRCGDGGPDPGIDARTAGSERHGLSGSKNGVASLPADGIDRPDEWSARERILALASPVWHGPGAGPASSSGAVQSQYSTRATVKRQTAAPGGKRFAVIVLDIIRGQSRLWDWDLTQVLDNVAWLKRMSAIGFGIFIRQSGVHPLPIFRQLNQADLTKICPNVRLPAISVGTASNVLKALGHSSYNVLPPHLSYLAARELTGALDCPRRQAGSDGFVLPGYFYDKKSSKGSADHTHATAFKAGAGLNASACLDQKRANRALEFQDKRRDARVEEALATRTKSRKRGRR